MSNSLYIRPKSNFTMIANGIFRDDTISLKAVGLYCQLASLPDRCKPSVQYLLPHHTDGKTSVMAAMEELCNAGWMKITTARSGGRFIGSIWQIANSKGDFDDIGEPSELFPTPDSGNRNTETPYPDFEHTGNPLQYKTSFKEDLKERKNTPHTPATPFGGTPDPLEPFTRLKNAYPKINAAILRNHPRAIVPAAGSLQELKAKKTLAQLVKLDKYTEDEVCDTLNWVLNKEPDSDGFTWKDQFRSIAQLREVKNGATKFTKIFESKKKFIAKAEPVIDPDVAEANRKWREGQR